MVLVYMRSSISKITDKCTNNTEIIIKGWSKKKSCQNQSKSGRDILLAKLKKIPRMQLKRPSVPSNGNAHDFQTPHKICNPGFLFKEFSF